jgi:hypothetical protein
VEELARTDPSCVEAVRELFDGVSAAPVLTPPFDHLSLAVDEVTAEEALRPYEWVWFKQRARLLRSAISRLLLSVCT